MAMERKTAGLLILGAGTIAAAAGAIALYRRNNPVHEGMGRSTKTKARGHSKSGSMKLSAYDSRRMQIKERVGILQDLTHKSVKDPAMRKLALQITKHCPARDDRCELRAIYDWTKKNIRYTCDIGPHKLGRNGPVEAVDLFQTAARTVEFGGGDCDDHSILNCTLAIHNGFGCKYRVTTPTRAKGEDYTHIYSMAGTPKNGPSKFVALDTTIPGEYFNKEAAHGKRVDFVA